ncbi:MAG: aldehyde ferredoxin oxidoreductase family protein [Proteobacteria bacterium]|nr:aldehyde ferredoxin oxidoreductase family protein [Pseudomonadota bacterium]
MHGHNGRIIRVDLTFRTCTIEAPDEAFLREYIGGRGIGVKLLFDEVDPQTDPLGPDNKMIIATGPLTGSGASSCCRYSVVTKSPLNGCSTSSNAGGHWGPELKFAGYDAIVIQGMSDTPVYLNILDDEIELLDAADLWGKFTIEVDTILKERNGGGRVLTIGPAGENLSKMAAIMNDKDRAAARNGVGAVLGAKKLKAVAVKATSKRNTVAAKTTLKALRGKNRPKIKEMTSTWSKYGTVPMITTMDAYGTLPVRNWQEGCFEPIDDVSCETMNEKHLVKAETCYSCPIACARVTRSRNVTTGGPEYETVWTFGPNCAVSDFNAIIDAGYWCNQYGLDTISTGSTIAAAMELYEKGIIGDEELDELSLAWGEGEAAVEWVKRIGDRKGLGDKMADGSYDLCVSYGVPQYSMSVKKLEMPGYDVRGFQGEGLSFATNNRGGCHVRGHVIPRERMSELSIGIKRTSIEQKELWVKEVQERSAVGDSLGFCGFGRVGLEVDDLADIYNCVCGLDETSQSLLTIGERIVNLERLWNLAAGFTAADDTLPKRMLEEPMPAGPSKGEVNRLGEMLPKYYRIKGWNEEGVPTPKKLAELGLEKYAFRGE